MQTARPIALSAAPQLDGMVRCIAAYRRVNDLRHDDLARYHQGVSDFCFGYPKAFGSKIQEPYRRAS